MDDHTFLTRVVNPFLVQLSNEYYPRGLRSYAIERVNTGGLMEIRNRMYSSIEEACLDDLFWVRDYVARGMLSWNNMLEHVVDWSRQLGEVGSPMYAKLHLLAWRIIAFQAGADFERLDAPVYRVKTAVISRGSRVWGEKVTLFYKAPPARTTIKLVQKTNRAGEATFLVPHLSDIQARALGVEKEAKEVSANLVLELFSNSIVRHLALKIRGRLNR